MSNSRQLSEKEQLIAVHDSLYADDFNYKHLIGVMSLLIICLLLFIPKIYIRSNIYYKSMQIEKLKYQYNSLLAENSELKAKLEIIKFNNLVIDTTF